MGWEVLDLGNENGENGKTGLGAFPVSSYR
jgi:hypothetical protein